MNFKQSLHRKPLHVQVSEILRKKILPRFEPGKRIDAESKLARQLGISVVTLRQSLSVLEHEGILERRHGSGTYVADMSAQQHIAIATCFASHIKESSFQLRVLQMLGSLDEAQGYRHRFYSWPEASNQSPADFAAEMERGKICGVIFVAVGPDPSLMGTLQKKNIPFVATFEGYAHGVAIDYVALVREGARHLLEQGCRNIALMQWSSLGEESMSKRSLEAFKTVLGEHGAPYEERWVRRAVPPEVAGAGWEQFREIWAARDVKPDGLLVADDVLFRDVALGILDSHIQVPEQLRVITHANKGSGVSYPFPVTFLEIDPQEFAEALAGMLARLIRQKPVSSQIVYVQPRLIPAGTPVQETMLNRRTESTVS